MRMTIGTKSMLILGVLFISLTSVAQVITSGRIVFERKTNLEKKFSDERMKEWLDGQKFKVDNFELIFNDTISIFRPVESNEAEKFSWMTSKSTVLQNQRNNEKLFVLDVAGQQIFVKDSITPRTWKLTDSKRTIDKYRCRKAVYEKNDSTRLYAWYAIDIVPSIGPEGFGGLPGAILGLATEDGSIIYFAKSVEFNEPKADAYLVNTKKKEIFTPDSLKAKFEKEMGGSEWAKRMYDEMFRWL